MSKWSWLRIGAGVAVCVLVPAVLPDILTSMTGSELVRWFILIGLVAGALIGSWWSPLVISITVFATILARDVIEDPTRYPGATEDTALTRSVITAIFYGCLIASSLVGTALGKIAGRLRPSFTSGLRWN